MMMILSLLLLSYLILAAAGLFLYLKRLHQAVKKNSVDDYHCSIILARNLGQDITMKKEFVLIRPAGLDYQLILGGTCFFIYLLASGFGFSYLVTQSNWMGIPAILILNVPVFLISYRLISLKLMFNWFSSHKTSWLHTRKLDNV